MPLRHFCMVQNPNKRPVLTLQRLFISASVRNSRILCPLSPTGDSLESTSNTIICVTSGPQRSSLQQSLLSRADDNFSECHKSALSSHFLRVHGVSLTGFRQCFFCHGHRYIGKTQQSPVSHHTCGSFPAGIPSFFHPRSMLSYISFNLA